MKDIQTFQNILYKLLLVNFAAMWKWPCIKGIFEILEKFYKFHVKLLVDFSRLLVKLRQSSKL